MRCARKICLVEQLDDIFFGELFNFEAVAFYVYATANGWHSAINTQLWSETPSADIAAFAEVLNVAIGKVTAIAGKTSTVYRGYQTPDIAAFATYYPLDQTIRFPGFTSASFSQAGAFGGNVLFIIRALSARAIWWLSPNFHEEEALLPTDCLFRVVDKQLQSVGGQPARLVIVLQEITKRP